MKPEAPEHVTHRRQIHALLEGAGLAARRADIDALIRPAIGLTTRAAGEADLAVGATRVGGEPDLAPGAAWPAGEEGPLLFVLQVRLADVTALDLAARLPPDGHLALFTDRYARDVRLVYTPAGTALARRPWCPTVRAAFPACGVDVRGELHVPPPASAFVATVDAQLLLSSDEHDAYWDEVWLPWREVLRPGPAGACGTHQLLGYAAAERFEAQALDEEVLVGFDSDDRAGMEWGDVHCVWVLITRAALARQAWTELRAEM